MDKSKRTAGDLWCQRSTAIKETHICVFAGSFRVAHRTVKVAIGANESGITQLLAYHISKGRGEDRWVTVLESAANNCRSRLVSSPFRGNGNRRLLFVTQSGGEIWKAIGEVFGPGHAIQACRTERERRVLTLVPEERRRGIKRALTKIWKQDEGLAVRGIEALAADLRTECAEASDELTTGLAYLFTINRLGLPSELRRFLATTGVISTFERNLRAKIRRRAAGLRNYQASVDALTAVCREDLLSVQPFDLSLAPLAVALKVSRNANDIEPTPAGRPIVHDAKSDVRAVTSLDADVRIRVTSNGGENSEHSLAMCVSWIKSVTTQMRSLLNSAQQGECADRSDGLSSSSNVESRVEEKTIILRPGELHLANERGTHNAHRTDWNLLTGRARSLEESSHHAHENDSMQGGTRPGRPLTVTKQLTRGASPGLPGHLNRETISLLPIRSVRTVVKHAGRLAKRIRPNMRPAHEFRPEPAIDHSTSRDIATLADRLFVIPGIAAPRCVVFSGLDAGAGCSRVTSSVAQTLASRVSGPVCIVDANCRDPFLHDHFHIDNSSGLIEAVAAPESLLDFAHRTSEGNLWVLPTHLDTTSPTGFPSTDHMRALVNELTAEFDYVLIDGPPLEATFDSALLARMSDGLVLVLEAERTLRERARSIKSDLELAEVRVLAAVLNKRSFPVPHNLYRWFGGSL